MLGKLLENVKKETPLIHCITNYVTVNDVANVVLAIGGSPIMSDEPLEAAEITAICNGLCLNIGTLNRQSIEAMMTAGKRAKELNHIILLDPVGAGASTLRTDTAVNIMNNIHPNVIRGNISEIKSIFLGSGTTKGVDADISDSVTEENLTQSIQLAKRFAAEIDGVIAITGAIDLVADKSKCYIIRNGIPEMSGITGTGCQLSALATIFSAACRSTLTDAVAAAVCTMGLAGELAAANMQIGDGNSTLRNRIIDAIYNMDADTLSKGARYEIR